MSGKTVVNSEEDRIRGEKLGNVHKSENGYDRSSISAA